MTTTAAPYFSTVRARSRKVSSPSLSEMEFTMPLPLQTFQSGFDDFPFRRVHHERHLRDFRLAAEQLQEARHRRDAIDHALVHADIDDVGAVLHLLPRDGDGLLVISAS